VKALAVLVALGVGLVAVAGAIGGKPAVIGGSVAVIAQLWAVALLRPRMRAPNPEFMARWLGGMGIRFLAAGALLVWAVTHRASLPLLPAVLGYLGVLLPLLFLETRFLR
jgi:F0F1-type ATP synthase assembly protein I